MNQVIEKSYRHLVLYCDGGARGNPGPAGAGMVLKSEEGDIVLAWGVFLGTRTNNQAEYLSLYLGLKKAMAYGVESLDVYMDSQLVVKQMTGEYKIKDKELGAIADKIFSEGMGVQLHIKHIRREKNGEADKMANLAMDKGRQKGEAFIYQGPLDDDA